MLVSLECAEQGAVVTLPLDILASSLMLLGRTLRFFAEHHLLCGYMYLSLLCHFTAYESSPRAFALRTVSDQKLDFDAAK